MREDMPSKYQAGELIDKRYKVVKLLGSGGMAEVYLTEDLEMHNRQLALKLLYAHVSLDKTNIERFLREVEITRNHNHPNIVKSYHYGRTEKNEQYFTMEFINGEPLSAIISRDGRIGYQKACNYLAQIADALATAHDLGIIHRDVKPDNIIVTENDEVKVTDFGIAKDLKSDLNLTELEKGPKSYIYKAPELYADKYDHRVDIYAFGITAFEMLTGKPPFEGDPHQLMAAHLTAPIPKFTGKKSGIPAWVQVLVDTCCAKTPDRRYDSMRQVQERLRACVDRNDDSYLTWLLDRIEYGLKLPPERLINLILSVVFAVLLIFLFSPVRGVKHSGLLEETVNFTFFDVLYNLRGPVKPPEQIVVVSIDDETFRSYNASSRSILPREVLAQGLSKIADYNPKSIILDLQLNDLIDPASDKALLQSLTKGEVFLAKFAKSKGAINTGHLLPNDFFVEGASGTFESNLVIDSDQRVRHYYFEIDFDNRRFIPPMARIAYRPEELSARKLPYPGDFIYYYGPSDTISSVAMHDLLSPSFNQGEQHFKDKFVFVGINRLIPDSSTPLDRHSTPFGATTAGVEIHATVLGNILENRWIKRIPIRLEVTLISSLFVLTFYYALNSSRRKKDILLTVAAVSWLVAASIMFFYNYYIPPLALPLMLFLGFLPIRARSFSEKAKDDFFK